MSTIGLYPEELDIEHFYFQWPAIVITQHMYRNIFKEGNGDHKYFRYPDLRTNNFEVMCSDIEFDKVNMVCEETVKYKLTGNDSGFITY